MKSVAGSGDGDPLVSGAARRPVAELAIAVMREQEGALPLRDIAGVARLSPYHFARTFKRETGVPPGEFMAALRLERAKRLLLTTNLSVGEVCFEVGYQSIGTFTTRFTQLVGVAPGRMRHLPEEAASILDLFAEEDLFSTLSYNTTGVSGRIIAPDNSEVLIFIGLFPGAIPQRRPVAGALLTSPGTYRLPPVPDGYYHLMAAAVPRRGDPLAHLLPDNALRVGRSPVLVHKGATGGPTDITLRPVRNIDPPVVVALPALLLERVPTKKRAR